MTAAATSRRSNGAHAKTSHANGKTGQASNKITARRAVAAQGGAAQEPVACASSNKAPSAFTVFAQRTAQLAGRPVTFMLSALVIVVWAVTGPIFNYSDTWQLVINTGTTIVTFLMVFLIQHTQNRDSLAFQVKLDELIIKLQGAGNEIAGAEDLCDEDLEALHETYRKHAKHASGILESRRSSR